MTRVSKTGHASHPQKFSLDYLLASLVADGLISDQYQQQLQRRRSHTDVPDAETALEKCMA